MMVTDQLYSTVGCHPTRCNEFKDNPDEYLHSLRKLINEDKGDCLLLYLYLFIYY